MRNLTPMLDPLRRVPATLGLACALLASAVPARGDEAAVGKRVFQNNCSICHTIQPGRNSIGPSLFGVVNRHSGQIPDFRYSEANRRSGLTWTTTVLDRYLAAPRKIVPGTYMTFPGLKDPKQRAEIIAFLATLH